jgi:hypothetical protein
MRGAIIKLTKCQLHNARSRNKTGRLYALQWQAVPLRVVVNESSARRVEIFLGHYISKPMNILKYHIIPYIVNNRNNVYKYGGRVDMTIYNLM